MWLTHFALMLLISSVCILETFWPVWLESFRVINCIFKVVWWTFSFKLKCSTWKDELNTYHTTFKIQLTVWNDYDQTGPRSHPYTFTVLTASCCWSFGQHINLFLSCHIRVNKDFLQFRIKKSMEFYNMVIDDLWSYHRIHMGYPPVCTIQNIRFGLHQLA